MARPEPSCPVPVRCGCGRRWIAGWLPLPDLELRRLITTIRCRCGADARTIHLDLTGSR